MNGNANIPPARRRIARIRCLQDCIRSLHDRKPFPDSLCYVPSELEYKHVTKTTWKLLEEPSKVSKVVKEISATSGNRLIVSGEDLCNQDGKWLKVLKVKETNNYEIEEFAKPLWLLLFSSRSSTEETPAAVPVRDGGQAGLGNKLKANAFKKPKARLSSWEAVIEETYSPILKKHRGDILPPDAEAVMRLKHLEVGWGMEQDGALTQLMAQQIPKESESLGCLKGFVEALDVSSYSTGDGETCNLTDEDPSTYWETDGSQGQHWIRLRMKKGTIIRFLSLTVAAADDNYLPEHIVVLGGEANDLKVLNNINIDWSTQTPADIKLLEGCLEHYPIITIRIKSCKSGGIDTRVRGIKLTCLEERSLGFDEGFFSGNTLVRFPVLQSYSPSVLYRRSIVLQRFLWLLDSVIHYLVPAWHTSIEGSIAPYNNQNPLTNLESIRQLLPLSKKRMTLIDTLLKGSASDPAERKIVYINRHAALEHRSNPSASPNYRDTVFMQLFEGLKPRDKNASPLNYRWSAYNDQWWECKFISEGIIDQGGGFRDSLSDVAEELCPSDPDAAMPLPYFIRSPNQGNEDGNVNQDVYIPNPSCDDLAKFEWIGQLMGACFRGNELLIVSLAPYVWKRLVGESYSWSKDFVTVDAAEVRIIDSLSVIDPETFRLSGRSWSCLLSDGSQVSLKVDEEGNPKPLAYEDREEYAQRVREIRLTECDKQLKAMKTGLLKVLPEAVLSLLTWQELEVRICGEPQITLEALMRSTYYHHLEEDDLRVKHFWNAVKNFSNEDRSRLLRFITGRRRLPVSIFISTGKSNPEDPLPESSTCCNTIHLPLYSDEKTAEEKLRYAAYNCVSIDTDGYEY